MTRLLLLCLVLVSALPMSAEKKYWNKGRGYEQFKYATREGIFFDNTSDTLQYSFYSLKEPSENFVLSFREKNFHGNPSKKYKYLTSKGVTSYVSNPHWGVFLTSERDTLILTMKGMEETTQLESKHGMELTLYDMKKRFKKNYWLQGVNPYEGENLWEIKVNDRFIEVFGGNRGIAPLIQYDNGIEVTGFGFLAGWGGKMLFSDISIDFSKEEQSLFPLDNLIESLSESKDELEGEWVIFDRDLEESLLKFGGDYQLVCIKEGEEYLFLYMGGANINSRNWNVGDVKAIMRPTPFPGIYDVEWMDTMKQSMSKEIRAQMGEGHTLLISFPYQSSSFRLRKLPKDY